ncbi:MAG: AGE family epimerase/isomerase [Lysobacterales bacterium]
MKNPLKKLARLSQEFQQWTHEDLLPLWWKQSRLDNGAFYEAIGFDGRPVPSSEARVRVQARQIYCMALAWKMGWRKKSLPQKLEASIDRFLDTCLVPEGVPGMMVDIEKGQLTDPKPNLYVSAYAILALAQSRKVLGGRVIDPKLDKLKSDIEALLAMPDGNGYRETVPANTIRLQNPHMHYYESLLCLYKVTGLPEVREQSEALLSFAHSTFFDQRTGVVQERVNPTLEMSAREYEPGHSMEWVWLLGWRSRLFKVPLDPFATRLYEHYCSAGIPEGETPMGLDVDHGPVDPSRRLWSQTESLKAHLTIAEQGPAELRLAALNRAIECGRAIQENWILEEPRGGWCDRFDADGEPLAQDIPASMFYHILVMVQELRRSAKKIRKSNLS